MTKENGTIDYDIEAHNLDSHKTPSAYYGSDISGQQRKVLHVRCGLSIWAE